MDAHSIGIVSLEWENSSVLHGDVWMKIGLQIDGGIGDMRRQFGDREGDYMT